MKHPGKVRFEYEKGVNMLIVSNGSSLTMIDYDVQQVQRWPIKNSPLGALLDPKRDVAQLRQARSRPTAPTWSASKCDDPKKPEYGVFTLILVKNAERPGGHELASWVRSMRRTSAPPCACRATVTASPFPTSAFKYQRPPHNGSSHVSPTPVRQGRDRMR